MSNTNVELYEALKGSVGQEAARMIAEVVPPTRDLATRADIAASKHELALGIAGLRADMHAEATRTIKWMVGVFVPMFVATWASIAALYLRV